MSTGSICRCWGLTRRAVDVAPMSRPDVDTALIFAYIYLRLYLSGVWGCEFLKPYYVVSWICVPDRPTLSYIFLRFRLGLLRPTDPKRGGTKRRRL